MIDGTVLAGAKAALLCGDCLLTYLRDDRPGLSWRGLWDLPGGGADLGESAEQCLFREVHEEFGLRLTLAHLTWHGVFPAMLDPTQNAAFFIGRITPAEVAAIRFGDEGQVWRLMPLTEWLTHPKAIAALQHRTRLALAACA